MCLPHLARCVRARARRQASYLALVRMYQWADDLRDGWEVALATGCPTPDIDHFIRRVAHAGITSDTFTHRKHFPDMRRGEKRLAKDREVVRSVLYCAGLYLQTHLPAPQAPRLRRRPPLTMASLLRVHYKCLFHHGTEN